MVWGGKGRGGEGPIMTLILQHAGTEVRSPLLGKFVFGVPG